MIQTPICWKSHVSHLLDRSYDSIDAPDVLFSGHVRPYLVQLDTISMFPDYAFGRVDVVALSQQSTPFGTGIVVLACTV